MATTTDALLVTANVGSIFEDPTSMLKIWTEEFLSTVSQLSPKMVALHCQEVGGKNYERSMQHVTDFVQLLMSSEELRLFDKVRIYLDEDYSSAEHFTALGNFYFFHESISDEDIQIFDFLDSKFVPVTGKEVHSGNIETVPTKEKSKFPQEIFPECKWSRKGFMRTRWNLYGTVFDLINIHLFHDASNFIAMESFPSVYCKNRQRALEHTLKRFHSDQYGIMPYFLFGDFNFRTDTQGVVKKLSEGLNAIRVQSSKTADHSKLQFRDESSQEVVLTLGKKEFSHQDHQKLFVGEDSDWLREYDRELESFQGQLYEFSIHFPPTYPYVEDSERGEMYMQTRCPSWCDRVFLSASARALVSKIEEETCCQYGLIGQNSCMGDHKPVFLRAALVGGLGTVSCCALPAATCTSCLSAASSVDHHCHLCSEQSVVPSILPVCELEQDHNGLVVPTFNRHLSPYTPDSTDTEPDLLEDISPREARFCVDFKGDKMAQGKISSLKHLPLSNVDSPAPTEGPTLQRNSSGRRSISKIPVHTRKQIAKDTVVPSNQSKIPMLKCSSQDSERDSKNKGKNVKRLSLSIPQPRNTLEERLIVEKGEEKIKQPSSSPQKSLISLKQNTLPLSGESLIPKLRPGDNRRVLSRQRKVEENSSDSDSESIGDSSYSSIKMQGKNETITCNNVEIQLSLVESTPLPVFPVENEPSGLSHCESLALGGSTTDSGVSVSPDLSMATPTLIDSPEKVDDIPSNPNLCHTTGEEETPVGPVTAAISSGSPSLERFSLVRRIQSASAMERKSSFPLPASVFIESSNASSLTGLGGLENDLLGMRTCRCMSDSSWRQRSSTISHSMVGSRMESRIRLISTSSHLDRSLPRLQSHHSSSEEDWFEEVADSLKPDEDATNCENEVRTKLRQIGGKVKRLSTHEEDVGKLSDTNLSGDDADGGDCKDTNKLSVLSQSQTGSARALAAMGKTLAQTCFVDTERGMVDEITDQVNCGPMKNSTEKEVMEFDLLIPIGRKESMKENIEPERDVVEVLVESENCQKQSKPEGVAMKKENSNANRCKACCVIS